MASFGLFLGGTLVQDVLLVDHPVELPIFLKVHLSKEAFKERPQLLVVRLLSEGQASDILHVLFKLDRAALTKLLHCESTFLGEHVQAPLLLSFLFQKLCLVGIWILGIDVELTWAREVPWELTFLQEVDQNDAKRFEVVSSRVLVALMATERQVLGRSDNAFVLLVRNMIASLRAEEALGKAIVDQIDRALLLALANEDVLGLHVSMDEVLRVQVL